MSHVVRQFARVEHARVGALRHHRRGGATNPVSFLSILAVLAVLTVLLVGTGPVAAATTPAITATDAGPLASTPGIPALSRDCGLSTKLSDGTVLWLFCDSFYRSNTGTVHATMSNSAAMASPWSPTVPVDHTYVFYGETNLNADPANPGGRAFVTLPAAPLLFPCPSGIRKAWPIGVTTVPNGGPGGTDRVLVYYERVCDQTLSAGALHFVGNGVGLAAYDYTLGSFSPAIGVAQPLLATTLNDDLFDAASPFGAGATLSSDGSWVYVYRCDTACYAGRVPVGQVATRASYTWWTGTSWGATAAPMSLPGESRPISQLTVQLVPQLATFVMVYTPCTDSCMVSLTDEVEVRTAKSPVGPWSAPIRIALPNCTLDAAVNPCTAAAGHVEQTGMRLTLSYSRANEGPDPSGRVHTASVPFAAINALALDANVGSVTNQRSATFTFAPPASLSAECSLDGAAYGPCTSPVTLTGVTAANHSFAVRSVTAGGTRSSPELRRWTVDTSAPVTTVGTHPPASTGATDATFAFGGADTQTPSSELRYECTVGAAAFAPCTSGVTLHALVPGAHTFSVRAVDRAGNRGPAVATTWTVTFVFTSTPPSFATLGAAFSSTFATNASALGTVHYAVTSGALPPGLTLTTAGTLAGTASVSGSYGPITVSATATWGVAAYTFTIAIKPSIAGTVRNAVTAAPIAGIRIQVFDASGLILGTTSTAADGTFQLGNLRTGTYRLSYYDPAGRFVLRYGTGAATLETATAVPVVLGTTSVAGADLPPLMAITGTVTDRVTGARLGAVRVGLFDASGTAIAIADTAADGTYLFKGLAPAAYRLAFTDTTGAHAIEYFSGATTLAAATTINAPGGGTTIANGALEPFTSIAGTVTDRTTGAPLAGIWVPFYDATGANLGLVITNAAGGYSIAGLHLGTYRVGFVDTAGGRPTQYWNNRATLASATPLVASGGALTADAAL